MSIEASVGELKGKLDMLIKIVEESEKKSAASRADIRERVEEVHSRMAGVQQSVANLASRVTVMEPFVDKAQKWEQRGIGALAAVGMVAGAVGSALTYFKDSVVDIFK